METFFIKKVSSVYFIPIGLLCKKIFIFIKRYNFCFKLLQAHLMKLPKIILFLFLPLVIFSGASAQIISTYAGTGIAGYSGDNGPATSAQMAGPYGIAFDKLDNLFIADKRNNVIRKITPAGVMSTYAGSDSAGYSGDGGPATDARLNAPDRIATDISGNVYFTDNGNNKIRKVDVMGIITTVPIHAATICPPYLGAPGGVNTAMADLIGIAVDIYGTIYFTDGDVNVMKTNSGDTAHIFAGVCALNYSGDGGPATYAALNNPQGLACDNAGNIYICDDGNNVIRRVDNAGIIHPFAGNGAGPGFGGDGGGAHTARYYGPVDMVADDWGNIYISDIFNKRIRVVNSAGIITTIAGDGFPGYSGDGGPATNASFQDVMGVAVDSRGDLYFSDLWNCVIRKVTFTLPLGIEHNSTIADLSLFPNPNSGIFTIRASFGKGSSEDASIEIVNLLGQTVYENKVATENGKAETSITLKNDLPGGIYLLHIQSGSESSVTRFVIAK